MRAGSARRIQRVVAGWRVAEQVSSPVRLQVQQDMPARTRLAAVNAIRRVLVADKRDPGDGFTVGVQRYSAQRFSGIRGRPVAVLELGAGQSARFGRIEQ